MASINKAEATCKQIEKMEQMKKYMYIHGICCLPVMIYYISTNSFWWALTISVCALISFGIHKIICIELPVLVEQARREINLYKLYEGNTNATNNDSGEVSSDSNTRRMGE